MLSRDLLIVEDDPDMAEVLRHGFAQSGYRVAVARDGGDGLRMAEQHAFCAIILDLLLPVLDGCQMASELRRRGNSTPILMLTARAFVPDIVRGLDAGAEDYMAKPFSFIELSARVRALIRRTQPASKRLQVADLMLDTSSGRVVRGTRDIQLTRTQFLLLAALMRAGGNVVRRRDIVDEVWGTGARVEDNTLDVAIRSLRAALDKGHARRLLHTVRGFGYRLDAA